MNMKMSHSMVRRLIGISCMIIFLPAIIGCYALSQNRSAPTSGFLKDYSTLREGQGDEPLMVYVNREVNFHIYDKVIIDPVSIIFSQDSDMAKITDADRQKMANYFFAVLEQNLSDQYIITSKPDSLTLRLRFALTDIKQSQVVMDTVSTVLPIDSAMNQIAYTTTGAHTLLGDVNAEMEILDAMTGQRLAAAVDSRSGVLNNVKEACDYWAKRVTQRLDDMADGDYLLKGK
jgi:hypothetical protein